jgi:GT2 family glycosyltransferase
MQPDLVQLTENAQPNRLPLTLSLVIPTYGREEILLNSVAGLLKQARNTPGFLELIIVDQTLNHQVETERQISAWADEGWVRWLRASEPNLTRAMNRGLIEARGQVVLFTDDDITPGDNMLSTHLATYDANPEVWAVVGQVLQPGEGPEVLDYQPKGGTLGRFMDFPFRRTEGAFIENAIACNLSVVKDRAVQVGGFDESFTPPVAARFETEFAKRLVASGGKIWFEPHASIKHLRAPSGGTRSKGSHLTSASPCFSMGDYYFALRQGKGLERFTYIIRKPFREIRTKFHLSHPWYIPVKIIGEIRGFIQAWRAFREAPKLLPRDNLKPATNPKIDSDTD